VTLMDGVGTIFFSQEGPADVPVPGSHAVPVSQCQPAMQPFTIWMNLTSATW